MQSEILEIYEDKIVIKVTIERPENGMIMMNGVAIPYEEYVEAWKNVGKYQPSISIHPTKAEPQDCSNCKYEGNQARIDGDCDGCKFNHIPMYRTELSNWTPMGSE